MILTLSTFYRRQKNFLYLPDSDRQIALHQKWLKGALWKGIMGIVWRGEIVLVKRVFEKLFLDKSKWITIKDDKCHFVLVRGTKCGLKCFC